MTPMPNLPKFFPPPSWKELIDFLKTHRIVSVAVSVAIFVVVGTLVCIALPPFKSYPARIKIVTSSDWTTVRIVEGRGWNNATFVSRSDEVIASEVQSDHLRLTQSIYHAQAGNIVEMIAEVSFLDENLFQNLANEVVSSLGTLVSPAKIKFEIDRGDLGWTHVQLVNALESRPVVVENLWWADSRSTGSNTKQFNIERSSIWKSQDGYDPEPEDASTLSRKGIPVYQGMFGCPGDGSDINAWQLWFNGNTPTANNLLTDFWPDIHELENDEKFATDMQLSNGEHACLFSSYVQKTVVRHFGWMKEYGIPGAFIRRSLVNYTDRKFFAFNNKAIQNAQMGAERNGRVFAIQYNVNDAVGPFNDRLGHIKSDWEFLTKVLKVTDSPNYLRHNGKPVVCLGGPLNRFDPRFYEADEAMALINWFKSVAGVTVVGEVPANWRKPDGPVDVALPWAAVFRSYDIIVPSGFLQFSNEPNTVGTGRTVSQHYTFVVVPDLLVAAMSNISYMPELWPGYSIGYRGPYAESWNYIPRRGGEFFNAQVEAIRPLPQISMAYISSFNSMSDGSAMYKLTATSDLFPVGTNLVPLNVDGIALPSDHYLQLAGNVTRMLRSR